MDFSFFCPRELIPALAWLGRREWLEYGYSNFEQRSVWSRPKLLDIQQEEKKKQSKELWDYVNTIMNLASKDVVGSFLFAALSKSIAGGPKVFQPTIEECVALENTTCSMTFEEYQQPYPVVIIEFPKKYREYLAAKCGQKIGPSHVIVHHDTQRGFVNVHAFSSQDNVISHITPARPEYKTIEDAIVRNQDNAESRNAAGDFKVAEIAQRLAVNFCMVMVLAGVKQVGPLEPDHYAKARKMAQRKDRHHREAGENMLRSTLFKIAFIQQIKLYEEEFLEPAVSGHDGEGRTHASPHPHWRRGHYRQQRYGPGLSETKLKFIKPVFVRMSVFTGDIAQTAVTYKIESRDNK